MKISVISHVKITKWIWVNLICSASKIGTVKQWACIASGTVCTETNNIGPHRCTIAKPFKTFFEFFNFSYKTMYMNRMENTKRERESEKWIFVQLMPLCVHFSIYGFQQLFFVCVRNTKYIICLNFCFRFPTQFLFSLFNYLREKKKYGTKFFILIDEKKKLIQTIFYWIGNFAGWFSNVRFK